MPAPWIDFKQVKERVRIRDVLARYGLLDQLTERTPGKLVGPCPLHGGTNATSFHVDCAKNVWHCFSACGGGNVIDFVMKIEGCGIRDAGLKLAGWFGLTFTKDGKPPATTAQRAQGAADPPALTRPSTASERTSGRRPRRPGSAVLVNAPLGRELKLDHEHPSVRVAGLADVTVVAFGIGYCTRGILKNRLAIPIHDERGELVAYAGRALDEAAAAREGLYKFPAAFARDRVLFNLHRARAYAASGLVVVEDFLDAMKVHQAGFPQVVALMGATLSGAQEGLLRAATDRLLLFCRGGVAGEQCARQFYGRMRQTIFLRESRLTEREEPATLTETAIQALLGFMSP